MALQGNTSSHQLPLIEAQAVQASYHGGQIEGDPTNGFAPYQSIYTRDYTYSTTELGHRKTSINDPLALLDDLASYDQTPASNLTIDPVPTDHFASLLEAAATANGAELLGNLEQDSTHGRDGSNEATGSSSFLLARSTSVKRKRNDLPAKSELFGTGTVDTKRRRGDRDTSVDEEDQEQLARERAIWGEEDEDSPSTFEFRTTAAEVAEDARNAGVHSAAALFRKPTAASKKYTRPPMSKLFTSLELTPEQFLHLQAAAKAYMLDERHPERGESVGHRGRGDTDMIKLKLFGCVKAFLDEEGWGERCFGEKSPGAETRKLRYPQMKNKIISLITPLLRRMVTNERQRLYALSTRKQNNAARANGSKSASPDLQSTPTPKQIQRHDSTSGVPQGSQVRQGSAAPLGQYHPELDPELIGYDTAGNPQYKPNARLSITDMPSDQADVRFHINLLQEGQRIKPKLILTKVTCPGLPSLLQHLQKLAGEDANGSSFEVKVLGTSGLISIENQTQWDAAVKQVRETDWMDGDLRVIAEALSPK
ncbi:hypothetical protein BP6252_07703 [Coleophoma cylindrospora]|uniref:Uncharacterized protein n=1 Tax=Coleophoma cylindrospora TaxID=1849047 RepID=A0A3D8RAY1_9HELO|nr:hypothetical protein BP6252_07703 [Coleophoma cylindrospora]